MEISAHSTVDAALKQVKANVSASEAHGILCGFLCAGTKINQKKWIEAILGQRVVGSTESNPANNALLGLYEYSENELGTMSFEFQLLLPGDDVPLLDRAEALGHWCQGFMAGMGLANIPMNKMQNEDLQEVMDHFAEISRIDYKDDELGEEDEASYIELVEYIRMAVLLVYGELVLKESGTTEDERVFH